MLREEWWRSRQGMKVSERRCGITSEAQPISGQTCPIEPAPGATGIQAKGYDFGGPHTPNAIETAASVFRKRLATTRITTPFR